MNRCCSILLFFLCACPGFGQSPIEENISLSVFAEASLPVFGDQAYFNPGFGGTAALEYEVFPFLSPFLHGGVHFLPVSGLGSLSVMEFGAGAGFTFRPTDRILLRAGGYGGVYTSRWNEY